MCCFFTWDQVPYHRIARILVFTFNPNLFASLLGISSGFIPAFLPPGNIPSGSEQLSTLRTDPFDVLPMNLKRGSKQLGSGVKAKVSPSFSAGSKTS